LQAGSLQVSLNVRVKTRQLYINLGNVKALSKSRSNNYGVNMSTKYLFAAIQARTRDPIAKMILIYLADSANQEGQCYPAHSTIAEMCETSVRTVKRKLDELCAMGFIDWDNRGHKGYKTSNMYQLCEPEVFFSNGLERDDPRRIKNEAKIGQPDTKIGQPDLTDRTQWPIEPISNLNNSLSSKRPSVEEVREYCQEKGFTINPDTFINYYESNGWKVGRSTMKSWKHAVSNWQTREKSHAKPKMNGTSTKSTTLQEDLTDTSWA
jgi:hypothetical protein